MKYRFRFGNANGAWGNSKEALSSASKRFGVPCSVMLNVAVPPALTLTVAVEEKVPGVGIGGSSGVRLEPPVNPSKTDSVEIVYVPGGAGISKCPMRLASREPNVSPKFPQVSGVGLFGSPHVLRLPGFPVNKSPDTAETALRRGLLVLRAIIFTPCIGVTPSLKNTVPVIVP